MRVKNGEPHILNKAQVNKTREVFAKFLVALNKDKHISKSVKDKFEFYTTRSDSTLISPSGKKTITPAPDNSLSKVGADMASARKFLKDDGNLSSVGQFYTSHGKPTEHAAVGFQKMLQPDQLKYGDLPAGPKRTKYKVTESFHNAAEGLKEMALLGDINAL